MPNILIDALPDTVMVDGGVYFINTDFRVGIEFEKTIFDNSIDIHSKVDMSLNLYFGSLSPDNKEAAINAILDFYRCGEATKPAKKKKMNGNVPVESQRIYDYDYDAAYIYAAFLTQYSIDLNVIDYMHWWKFHYLFKALEERNKIVEIMGYRSVDISNIKNKTERNRIEKLKALYAIPDSRTHEDKIATAGAAFGGM